jgi:PAS domain S-box-containing protein
MKTDLKLDADPPPAKSKTNPSTRGKRGTGKKPEVSQATAIHFPATGEMDERNQAEAVNAYLAAIVESSQDAIMTVSLDGRFVSWNAGAEKLFGYRAEEAIGQSVLFFVPEDKLKEARQILKRRAAGERILPWDTIRRRKDGSLVDVSLAVSPIRDTQGRLIGSSTVFRDITERKRAEEGLRESQKKYQALIETTSDFIWEMDSTGRYTYCSPQMEALWGLKPEEMIGKTPFDVMPENDKARVLQYFQNIMSSPCPFRGLETSAYDSQGHLIYIDTNGVPFYDDEGKLLGFRGVSRDITERKKMEMQFKDTSEKYSALFNHTSDGVWINNLKGEILEVNDAYCKMTGYSTEEFTRMPVSKLEVAETPKEISLHIKKLIERGGHDRFESKHRRKDGSVFDVDITALYLEREGGRIAIFVRDITERKKTEALLKSSEKRLSNIIESWICMVFQQKESLSEQIVFHWSTKSIMKKLLKVGRRY